MRRLNSWSSPRTAVFGTGIGVILLAAVPCAAQGSPDYIISVADGDLTPAGAAFPVIFDSFGSNIAGWRVGVCHDPAAVQLISVESGSTALTAYFGNPVGYDEIIIHANGYEQLVIICPLAGCSSLPPGTGYELTIGHYAPVPGTSGTAQICPCHTFFTPPEYCGPVAGGMSVAATLICGDVTLPDWSDSFVRGDANDSGSIDVADAVWLLSELFSGGPHTDCDGANDVNSDGTLDIADPLVLLAELFAGGPSPAAPYPTCGPTAMSADCAIFTSCP